MHFTSYIQYGYLDICEHRVRSLNSLGHHLGLKYHYSRTRLSDFTFTFFFHALEKEKVKVKWLSRARLLVTPWTAAHQAPPSIGFSRQEYWSGVPLPSPTSKTSLSIFLKKVNISIVCWYPRVQSPLFRLLSVNTT